MTGGAVAGHGMAAHLRRGVRGREAARHERGLALRLDDQPDHGQRDDQQNGRGAQLRHPWPGQAVGAGVIDLPRPDHARAGRGHEHGRFLFFFHEHGRGATADDTQKHRLARIGQLHFDAQVADLDGVALGQARRFDRLAVHVGAGDGAFVGDQVAGDIALDECVLECDGGILGAQFLIGTRPMRSTSP